MRSLTQQGKTDLSLRDTANRITATVPAKDWPGELQAIFDYVRAKVRYTLDTNDIEVLQRADVTLALGYGDCDDMAICLATLLELAGHPCCFVALGFSQPGQFSHVIVICNGAGETGWISLDATEDEPAGWFPPGVTCDIIAPITPFAHALIQG